MAIILYQNNNLDVYIITTQKYYNYIKWKMLLKHYVCIKCVNVMYYNSFKYFIKDKMPPPPPPGSLFPLSCLIPVLYNKVNKVINVIQISHNAVCNKNKLNEQLVLYINVHLANNITVHTTLYVTKHNMIWLSVHQCTSS